MLRHIGSLHLAVARTLVERDPAAATSGAELGVLVGAGGGEHMAIATSTAHMSGRITAASKQSEAKTAVDQAARCTRSICVP